MEGRQWKIILAIEGALSIALLVLVAALWARRAKPVANLFSNDYWVCATNNSVGNGTLANPFDGSTRAKFDQVMNSRPPHSTIHLLVGAYETYGVKTNSWVIKNGQRILGSGIDNTIIHLQGSSIGNTLPGGTNIEVSDLTIDASGTTNQSGLFLWGDHSAIRRVKAVHFDNSTFEIFPLAIDSYWYKGPSVFYSEANIIEECEVDIDDPGPFSAISLTGGPTLYESGTIRNNRVIATPSNAYHERFAINLASTHDVVVEGNFVYGTDVGLYSDFGSNTNIIVVNNSFQNVLFGAITIKNGQTNISYSLNNISLAPMAAPAWNAGFAFVGPNSGLHRNILISQNTIQFYSAPGTGPSYSSYHDKCEGVRFLGNRLDPRLGPKLSRSSGVDMFNNSALDGGPWRWDRQASRDGTNGVAK